MASPQNRLVEHLLIYSVSLSPFRRNNVCKLGEARNKHENTIIMWTQSEKDWVAPLTAREIKFHHQRQKQSIALGRHHGQDVEKMK